MIKKLLLGFFFFLTVAAFAQDRRQVWVDSVMNTLNAEKKIGQLFLIPIPENANDQSIKTILNFVKDGKVGGLIKQKSSLSKHINVLNQLQLSSKVPLLVAASVANGLGEVIDSAMNFYSTITLGSVDKDSLIEAYAGELASQMKVTGIQWNLASNNSNFYNDDPSKNRIKMSLFNQALIKNGLLTNSIWKSDADSAQYPIKGFSAIQYSLNNITSIDKIKLVPLRNKLLEGLLMVDVAELQSLLHKKKKGEAERIGFVKGFDVMMAPQNIDAGIKQIKKLVKRDKMLATQLDLHVRRILNAKYQAGFDSSKVIPTTNIYSRLHSPQAKLLKQEIAKAAVTVVQNKSNSIPINGLANKSFASLSIGVNNTSSFASYLSKYAAFTHFLAATAKDTTGLAAKLNLYDEVVIGLFPMADSGNQFSGFINSLAKRKKVILCNFGDPLNLKSFENIPSLIEAYSDEEELTKVAAQIIFGGLKSEGSLPISVSDAFRSGIKINTSLTNRFSYQVPESAGMDSRVLDKIETIAKEAIDLGATPGCYVQVVKDGKVIYDRGFGWLTYEKKSPVMDQTIYDLASVTKVTATLQTVMYMYEHGMIDPYKKISFYLPELKESNKSDFTIKDILTHQAGLWPFLPFWAETVKDSVIQKQYYGHEASEDFPFPVAENLFASKAMKDSLWQWIVKAKVREKITRTPFDYRYSDMGFYIMQHLAEKILGMPMEDFLQKNIYQPIGASTMGYLPLRKFPMYQIAPTEDDKLFRKKLLTGYVHDQGAAMHGGIAGHAGLFSNANDLAKMGQLWLNGGSYGGVQFLKPETLDAFTQRQYETSRRGLGWDRPTTSDWNGPTTLHASAKTFGHTGFTGTCVWVDPEFNLVYVFLSNRVHPDMTNNKILNANIRPRIQEVIYQSIFEYCAKNQK